MNVTIENLLGKVLFVQRNNGASLSIAPGSRGVEIPVTEWKTNLMLKKLAARGVLRRRETAARTKKGGRKAVPEAAEKSASAAKSKTGKAATESKA
jgi:hypothetical protein